MGATSIVFYGVDNAATACRVKRARYVGAAAINIHGFKDSGFPKIPGILAAVINIAVYCLAARSVLG